MTVIVYEKDFCQPCRLTKMTLERLKINYETRSAEENLGYLRELGHMEAPVVVHGKYSWSGFRPDLIEELSDRVKQN